MPTTSPRQVGGNGGFPDEPLEITAPGEESGTYDAFIELSGFEDIAIAQGVPEDGAAALRPDYQSSANDNVIIQAIEGSTERLGWVGFAFAEQSRRRDQGDRGRRRERLRRAVGRDDRRRQLPAVTRPCSSTSTPTSSRTTRPRPPTSTTT